LFLFAVEAEKGDEEVIERLKLLLDAFRNAGRLDASDAMRFGSMMDTFVTELKRMKSGAGGQCERLRQLVWVAVNRAFNHRPLLE
jgi:hypothetical protein